MVDPQTSRFWRSALQSGLIDEAALQTCWDKIPEEKRTIDAVERRLARQAVNGGLVSLWQAQQLIAGRASGYQIDRYVLVDLIGQGGMGRVYLAKDTRLGRKVALKVLSTSRMSNPRAIVRFQREGKVGAQLQHENLVRIYDEGESGSIRYLVMEFIEGKNIAQLIGEQGAIDWPAAVRLIRQIALGLEHAHQKGLIHRDVNPSNILVTRDGTAKLTDLGLAIDLADEANVTRDGATVGTFDYISPEQAKHSRDVDTRADIYSLGCSLYHMITGRVPFPVPSLPEKLYAHQLHDATPLHDMVNDVPEGLSNVVKRMMAKRPEDRFQTPLAVAQALEPFVDEAARVSPKLINSSRSSSGEIAAGGPKTQVSAPIRLDDKGPEPPAAGSISPASTGLEAEPSIQASDPDLAIFTVDTGPDEPLSSFRGGSSKVKSKSKSSVIGGGEDSPGRRVIPPMVIGGIALALIVIVTVGIISILLVNRGKSVPGPVIGTSKKKVETNPSSEPKTIKPENAKPAAISVVSRNGTRVAETLADAFAIASNDGGDIVLQPSKDLRLAADSELRLPRGNVTIRAAEGTLPMLAIDVGATNAPVLTLPNSVLTIKGLKVIAHYVGKEKPPPLIHATGRLRLEGCTFVASGSTAQSRAVLVQGLGLDVEGCLFVGFDRPIHFDAFPGSMMSIKQSILAHVSAENPGSPAWGIRVQSNDAPQQTRLGNRRQVKIDHTTVQGGGLLEISGFSAANPLEISLDHVATQTRALLGWAPLAGETDNQWAKGLKWLGTKNHYDVTGSSWILITTNSEVPMPNAPTDLASWSKAIGSDNDTIAQSFSFATAPATLAADVTSIDPERFALVGDNLTDLGADPKKVGPQQVSADKP